jgi:hypothetical protein
MGATKKMQMLHSEFEAAVDDGDAELVLSLGPYIVNELQALTRLVYSRLSPLTDKEREAIEWAINDQIEGGWENHETVKDVIAALRGLLERAKECVFRGTGG